MDTQRAPQLALIERRENPYAPTAPESASPGRFRTAVAALALLASAGCADFDFDPSNMPSASIGVREAGFSGSGISLDERGMEFLEKTSPGTQIRVEVLRAGAVVETFNPHEANFTGVFPRIDFDSAKAGDKVVVTAPNGRKFEYVIQAAGDFPEMPTP